jgi:hypothetical protein
MSELPFADEVLSRVQRIQAAEAFHLRSGGHRASGARTAMALLVEIENLTKARFGDVAVDAEAVAAWKAGDGPLDQAITVMGTLGTPFAQIVREQLISALKEKS